MAITYNAGTDTITVTAGTAGAPNTFTDIYNADVAGAWGQVTKTSNMFVFSAKLQVGDGSTATYLHDTYKKVTLNEIWTVKNNAELKTGVQSGGNPRKGCFLVLNTTAAVAINVESGGTFYQYQTPYEDTGAGVNAISGETEDFYRGVQVVDLKGGSIDNYVGVGLAENTLVTKVIESIIPYLGMPGIVARFNTVTLAWETCIIMGGAIVGGFTAFEPGLGHSIKVLTDCTLIVDTLVDGEHYNGAVYAGISTKYRFDIPAGGGGLMRNPPMTGGTV